MPKPAPSRADSIPRKPGCRAASSNIRCAVAAYSASSPALRRELKMTTWYGGSGRRANPLSLIGSVACAAGTAILAAGCTAAADPWLRHGLTRQPALRLQAGPQRHHLVAPQRFVDRQDAHG